MTAHTAFIADVSLTAILDERAAEAEYWASEARSGFHADALEPGCVTAARAMLRHQTEQLRVPDLDERRRAAAAALGYRVDEGLIRHPSESLRTDSWFAPRSLLAPGQGGMEGIRPREKNRDLQTMLPSFSFTPGAKEYVNPYVDATGKGTIVANKATQIPVVNSGYRELRGRTLWAAIKVVGDHWTDRPYAGRRAFNKSAVEIQRAQNALLDLYESILRDGAPGTGVHGLATLPMPEVLIDLSSADQDTRINAFLAGLDEAAENVNDEIEFDTLMMAPAVMRRFNTVNADNFTGFTRLMTGLQDLQGITQMSRVRGLPGAPAGYDDGTYATCILYQSAPVESSSGTLARPVGVMPTLVSSATLHSREDIYAINVGGVDLPRPDIAVRLICKLS